MTETEPGPAADRTPPRSPAPSRPWLAWAPGQRVVVRYRIPADDGGPHYSDALGEVLSSDAEHVVVRTRGGDVDIPAAAIAVGKLVPPPPPRRATRR